MEPDDDRRASWQDDPGPISDRRLADIVQYVTLAFSGVTTAQLIARIDAAEAERDRLRDAMEWIMSETGTSTLAHDIARAALSGKGET